MSAVPLCLLSKPQRSGSVRSDQLQRRFREFPCQVAHFAAVLKRLKMAAAAAQGGGNNIHDDLLFNSCRESSDHVRSACRCPLSLAPSRPSRPSFLNSARCRRAPSTAGIGSRVSAVAPFASSFEASKKHHTDMTEVNNGTASLEPAYNIISRTFMVPTPSNISLDPVTFPIDRLS